MRTNWGSVPANSVIPFFFDAFAAATGASVTLTGLATTDIQVYKGTSMTQRASTAGFTLLDTDGIDLDGTTGIHGFSIDTSDNTDAGFYSVGSFFTVVVATVTIDGQTVNFVAGTFRLMAAEAIAGKPKADVDAWLGTAAATPTVAGVPEVDVTHWIGTATATPTVAGVPEVDITHFGGSAGTFAAGRPEVNTTHWRGTAAAVPTTAGVPAVETTSIDGSTTAATNLRLLYAGVRSGTSDSGTTTTMVDAARTEADTDYFKGDLIIFTSGNLLNQARTITAFDPATDTITFSPAVTQAVSTQTYIIVPAGDVNAASIRSAVGLASANLDTQLSALPTDADVTAAVWDADATAHQGAGTFGFEVGDPADWGDTSIRDKLDTIQTSMPNAGAIAAGVMAEIVEGAFSVGDSFRLWNSALGGKASGLGTTTAVFRDLGDTKNRISATVDADGNRSAVTLDLA